MLVEKQRYLHEDIERLEVAIAERIGQDSHHIRDRLNRDHEVAQLLDQISKESADLLEIYEDAQGLRSKETLQISSGDPFEEFYKQCEQIREHHAKYPNLQAENSETRYKSKTGEDGHPLLVEGKFSGEEAYGRFFDLHACHEQFLNLPNAKRSSYLKYLEIFDDFTSVHGVVKRQEKLSNEWFKYLGSLMQYLESFFRRIRPLENLEKVFSMWDEEFAKAWEEDRVPGWEIGNAKTGSGSNRTPSSPGALWCEACEKEFKNQNVFKGHLNGKKHVKAVKEFEKLTELVSGSNSAPSAQRIKERAVAEREFRIKKMVSAMSTERSDTQVNIERRLGMTDRERAQELENLFNAPPPTQKRPAEEEDDDENGEEKIYNPLKLPLAWDGKPIPFWLYRLHGLGLELPCEICGGYTYRGRRAFEKHFNEAQHITNLRRLGITNTHLFRDITGIDEALKLWEKIQRENKVNVDDGSVVQMEDAEGNVMPEKVYWDLQKQGLL